MAKTEEGSVLVSKPASPGALRKSREGLWDVIWAACMWGEGHTVSDMLFPLGLNSE